MDVNSDATHSLTKLLQACRQDEPGARGRFWDFVYGELHQLAQAHASRERPGRTLQPTALVHEAYLRLMSGDGHFENRRHFFAAAARAMQQIRVDDARNRNRLKRGGGAAPERLDQGAEHPATFDGDPDEIITLNDALDELARDNPDLAEVVRLRYFAGLSTEETAEVLGVAVRSVFNRWRLARAWLYDKLKFTSDP